MHSKIAVLLQLAPSLHLPDKRHAHMEAHTGFMQALMDQSREQMQALPYHVKDGMTAYGRTVFPLSCLYAPARCKQSQRKPVSFNHLQVTHDC